MSDSFLDDVEDDEDEDVVDVEAEVIEDDSSAPPAPDNSGGIIEPATDDLEEVAEVYEQFEEIKHDLLTKDDRENIGNTIAITKSGWRKIATAFNISFETVDEEKVIEDGVITWRVKAVATAPNGKTSSGVAMCASNESNHMEYIGDDEDDVSSAGFSIEDERIMMIDGKWRLLRPPREVNEHNIYATAATRAKNRAISDLVGGGEVSAEELDADEIF